MYKFFLYNLYIIYLIIILYHYQIKHICIYYYFYKYFLYFILASSLNKLTIVTSFHIHKYIIYSRFLIYPHDVL